VTRPPLQRDIAERPQLWFAPLDPSPPDASRPFSGRLDFMSLFEPEAPWEDAAAGIHIFKLYGGWVGGTATPEELKRVVADLNRRGIAIGFEASPLTQTEECGAGVEGFSGVTEGLRIVQKLKAAGAEVRFVAFDHPYDAGVLDDGPTACHWSPEKTAANVADYVAAIRGVYPDIVVGDIETAALDVDEVERWVDAYRQAVGEDLAFFHLDHDFRRPGWQEATLAIESFLGDRGVDFGMIYIGNQEDESDAQWLAHAEERMVAYEVGAGGRPDHVILQSWHPHPERLLPETDAAAFTNLVTQFLRTRTAIEIELATGSDGAPIVQGVLTTADGAPLGDATVEVAMLPVDGAGIEFEYTVSGTVPTEAIDADLGYRVNLECDCSGSADFILREVRYVEADGVNRVPNGAFSLGLEGWGSWGDAPQELTAAGLSVGAGAGQEAAINSAKFPVTAGAAYTVTFVARVNPASAGSGYFSLIFSYGGARRVE
jgi:hypothetical protein